MSRAFSVNVRDGGASHQIVHLDAGTARRPDRDDVQYAAAATPYGVPRALSGWQQQDA